MQISIAVMLLNVKKVSNTKLNAKEPLSAVSGKEETFKAKMRLFRLAEDDRVLNRYFYPELNY